jgi:hypothetical protein
VAQRGQRADRRVERRVAVDDRGRGADRLAHHLTGEVHEPAHRLPERVEGRAVGVGSVLPEPGDRDQDDAAVELPEPLVIEPHRPHDAGTEVLQHDVGLPDEGGEDLLAARAAQVEAHALFTAVVHGEVDALPADERRHPPRLLAAGRLDLDDVGAEVREQQAAARSGLEPRELEHPHAVETVGHHRPPALPPRPAVTLCAPARPRSLGHGAPPSQPDGEAALWNGSVL